MNFESFAISKDFSKVFAVVVGMNVQLWYISRQISLIRKKIYNVEFMQKHFGTLHKNELNEQIQYMGYPDSGNNIYAKALSYGDWYQFNTMQKLHQDYLQQISIATLSVLCSGAVNTNYGLGVGISYMIGKLLQRLFYPRQKAETKIGTRLGKLISKVSIGIGLVIFLNQLLKK